ncbi:hypothetical protein OSB04_000857 [Centaurea solstitialis]|uniref:Integrase catalytic domain-containing protein n=1 Tax=Centaurea solstitialis TaxID=347529 RepID=A0AA38WUQ5_9ASTR|nr:hypothetical protein OSB04_000857 [Centaurea solstitialis]
MDLITKLPKTPRKFDAIWVIVDRLTKSAHFLAIRESFTSEQLAELYVKEVVKRHGVPVSIISDRDTRFTSRFWERFHADMGTIMHFSTAYHPQTDGQSERTIQTLEDMLRSCVLDFGGSWDTYLPLAEFSYNNSYHSSIGMPPYEMLYGRRCRTPICWGEVGQRVLGSTEVVQQTTEHIQRIRERLRTAQSRQKSYADKRRSVLEFQVGDRDLLKVSPWKGVIRFRKRGKLGPRYIGPFTVLARVGKVAYVFRIGKWASQAVTLTSFLLCSENDWLVFRIGNHHFPNRKWCFFRIGNCESEILPFRVGFWRTASVRISFSERFFYRNPRAKSA